MMLFGPGVKFPTNNNINKGIKEGYNKILEREIFIK